MTIFSATMILIAQAASKAALGWVIAFIGLALGLIAVCFPGSRLAPNPEDREAEAAAKKKKPKKKK
jgi:hypothetical protein